LAYTAIGCGRRRGLDSSDRHLDGRWLPLHYQLPTDNAMNTTTEPAPDFEIRFNDLFQCGRWLSFPCDERGRVDIDALSQHARTNYLFARAMVGREYAVPSVRELAVGA
jgi:hypothetical protein